MKPLISVLMANYNHGGLIGTAIASVQAQTLAAWELVIVDDGSRDDSLAAIARAAAGDPRIRLEGRAQNRGVGYAKRLCAELANAPVLAVLDPDDRLAENALEVMVAAHAERPQASLIWSNCYLCDPDLRVKATTESGFVGDAEAGCLTQEPGCIHSFWSFKREFYDMTGGFNAGYPLAEDQDLFYKLEEVGATSHVPDVLYYYRIHEHGISTGARTAEAFGWHLLVMQEALRRRSRVWDRKRMRHAKRAIAVHWESFFAWGITHITRSMLRRLRVTAWRSKLSPRILWSCAREELRRKIRSN